jgi:hypothetical protein
MLMPGFAKSALLSSALVAFIGGLAAAGPLSYDGYVPPKDSLGRPDLTGVWGYSTATSFERPTQYGTRLVLTEQEVAAIEGRIRSREELGLKPTDPKATVKDLPSDCSGGRKNCNYNAAFTDPGSTVMRIHGEPHTSLITTTANGKIPPALDGRVLSHEINPEDETPMPGQERPDPPGKNDNPETRGLSERCVSYAEAPPLLPTLYNNNIMIQQSRDSVAIEQEMIHSARIVRLNAKHRTDGVKQWGGDAIGWYEGNTLVVETIGLDPRQAHFGGSDQTKVTERFTRVSPTRLDYAFTIEDPKTWAKPWGGEYELTASPALYEYACHEGNYALANILSGARHREAEAKKTASGGR